MAGERALTDRLARFFGAGKGVVVGIGDDAAVVETGKHSVICCDPVIEGVHFLPSDAPRLVGQKAVNRNLADLAAMGALPDWLLVSLVLPTDCPAVRTHAVLQGIRLAARRSGCAVVGGDVAVAPGPLVVTVTAIGHLAGPRPLLRSTALAGDTLHVTGPLGGSRAGHHLRFSPPLQEGAWLAGQRGIGAAMDVSDGLLLDLATMLRASGGLGAELDAAAIPIRAAARKLSAGDPDRALRHALQDGEDHVLLWTQRPGAQLGNGGPLKPRWRRPIGRVLARKGLWLVHRNGCRERVVPAGFEHSVS